MNKKVFGRKLSRSRPAREALFASMARSVILNGKIITTRAKAKAVQGNLEKMVTMAKKGDLASRRRLLAKLDNAKDALEALFSKVTPALSQKTSGYIKLTTLPPRRGDNARMVRMEWTENTNLVNESKSKKKTKTGNIEKTKMKSEKTNKKTKT
jgi:large subunit ribosomal protein L17